MGTRFEQENIFLKFSFKSLNALMACILGPKTTFCLIIRGNEANETFIQVGLSVTNLNFTKL